MVIFVVCFALICALCGANSDEDLALQKELQSFDGALAQMRDSCLAKTSMKITDVKVADHTETSDKQLCFFKCLYEEIGLLDQNGSFVANKVKLLPAFAQAEDDKMQDMIKCLQDADKVATCADLQMALKCFDVLKPEYIVKP